MATELRRAHDKHNWQVEQQELNGKQHAEYSACDAPSFGPCRTSSNELVLGCRIQNRMAAFGAALPVAMGGDVITTMNTRAQMHIE